MRNATPKQRQRIRTGGYARPFVLTLGLPGVAEMLGGRKPP
jgi:hypothetical protein